MVNGRPTTVIGVMPARLPPAPADGLRGARRPRGLGAVRPEHDGGPARPAVPARRRAPEAGRHARAGTNARSTPSRRRSRRSSPSTGAPGRRYDTVGLHADGVREIRPFCSRCSAASRSCSSSRASTSRASSPRGPPRAGTRSRCGSRSAPARTALPAVPLEGLVLSLARRVRRCGGGDARCSRRSSRRGPRASSRIAAATIDRARARLHRRHRASVGGAPLARAARARSCAPRRSRGSGAAGMRSRSRTRTALVAVQIALGVVLVVGAGLVARSFSGCTASIPGSAPDRVLSFRLGLPGGRYDSDRSPSTRSAAASRRRSRRCPASSPSRRVSHLPFDHIPNWGGPYVSDAGRGRDDGADGRLPRRHAGLLRGGRRAPRRGPRLHGGGRREGPARRDRRRAARAPDVAERERDRPAPGRRSAVERAPVELGDRRRRRAAPASPQPDGGSPRADLLPAAADQPQPRRVPRARDCGPGRARRPDPAHSSRARSGAARSPRCDCSTST